MTGGPDPVLAQFQATDPTTGQPYADDFGWLSHTYDTPYLDVGCATAELRRGRAQREQQLGSGRSGVDSGHRRPRASPSRPTTPTSFGTENPQVFVPGNHSGLADLVPGTPATVDPPDLDAENVSASGGTLASGSYVYAVTDQFNGSDSPSDDQSQAYVTPALSVPDGGSVSLVWQAICHAANYLIYREVSGSNDWYLIGNYPTPASATLPDNSSGDPVSTTDVTGGGEKELTFTDTGQAGTRTAGRMDATDGGERQRVAVGAEPVLHSGAPSGRHHDGRCRRLQALPRPSRHSVRYRHHLQRKRVPGRDQLSLTATPRWCLAIRSTSSTTSRPRRRRSTSTTPSISHPRWAAPVWPVPPTPA